MEIVSATADEAESWACAEIFQKILKQHESHFESTSPEIPHQLQRQSRHLSHGLLHSYSYELLAATKRRHVMNCLHRVIGGGNPTDAGAITLTPKPS